VVVVAFASDFVAAVFAGKVHTFKPLFFYELADVAVDGSDAESFDGLHSQGADLFRRQRPVCFDECCANGFFLPGRSWFYRHGASVSSAVRAGRCSNGFGKH